MTDQKTYVQHVETDHDDDVCPSCDGEGVMVLDCIEDSCCCVDPDLEHGVMDMEGWSSEIDARLARGLIQREHAACVRKVKAMQRSYEADTRKGYLPQKNGYLAACADLLAWLNERGR